MQARSMVTFPSFKLNIYKDSSSCFSVEKTWDTEFNCGNTSEDLVCKGWPKNATTNEYTEEVYIVLYNIMLYFMVLHIVLFIVLNDRQSKLYKMEQTVRTSEVIV